MTKKITLLIADNQILTREGLISVLTALTDINIIGIATTAAELEDMISRFKPDVIIMDYHFTIPDKKDGNHLFYPSHTVLLSNSTDKDEIQQIIKDGAKVYLSKNCSSDELIKAVHAAAKGLDFFCAHTIQKLLEGTLAVEKTDEIPQHSSLEIEIIHLIAEGITNKEIAEKLFLSIHTIKTHRKNIIKKLGFSFKNTTELSSLIKLQKR
jgi:two-component system NarL family response regulator